MDRRITLAMSEDKRALELELSTPGLGFIQALRVVQSERMMQNNLRRRS